MAETVRRTMTVEEAGRQLGIGRNTAYEAARIGQIPTIRIGKRLIVPAEAFEQLLQCAPHKRAGKPGRDDK